MPSMREALESAIEEHNEPEQVEDTSTATATEVDAGASAPEAVESPDEVSTEEKSAAPEPDTKETAAPVDKAPQDKPETAEQRAAHRVDRAPASWKKEAKGDWAALPLHVRQEVYKREMEVERVLKETAPIRQQIQEIQNVVSPYMARIQSAGVTPVQAMNELFKADFVLATGTPQSKAQMMAKLVKDYGVNIEDLDAAIVARYARPAAGATAGLRPELRQPACPAATPTGIWPRSTRSVNRRNSRSFSRLPRPSSR